MLRDRLLASPGFQRRAARFPLTRPIARSRARALFDICAGFVYSQVLFACVRAGLFQVLAEGPQDVATLQRRLDLPREGALRLLDAAVSLELAEHRSGGRYGLGPLGAALLGNPGIAAMVEHHALLYADLADPLALLRGEASETALGGYWPYAAGESPAALTDDRVAAYSELMGASQPMIASEVLDAYDVGRHRCLMDVGGGEGVFLAAAAARAPALSLRLFDLPAVAARARRRFAECGLEGRAEVRGGDFFRDSLPRGADLITLVRVVHDHDEAAVLTLLKAVHAALPEGGRLLLAEPMADTAGATPVGGAYFGFYLLAMGSGRPRSPAALKKLLESAGFRRPRLLPTAQPLLVRVMIAER